jgi:hypothetical protein
MKKIDSVLIAVVIALVIIAAHYLFKINMIFKIIIGIFIISLFLYKQIKPYKNAMFPKYRQWFSYIELVFDKLFGFLSVKPLKLGNTLFIDASALITLIILIALLFII